MIEKHLANFSTSDILQKTWYGYMNIFRQGFDIDAYKTLHGSENEIYLLACSLLFIARPESPGRRERAWGGGGGPGAPAGPPSHQLTE